MVEAAGVESGLNFAVVRDHTDSFLKMRAPLSDNRTTMHRYEIFLSRPVPSKEGAGGVVSAVRLMERSKGLQLISKNQRKTFSYVFGR
jgi:hypothetical protein